mgnify:CR=1 FL=1
MHHFFPSGLRAALVVSLVGSGCAVFRPGDAAPDPVGELLLTPIRTEHRYLTTSDLPQAQLRAGLINIAFRGERAEMSLAVGLWQPREGLFKIETAPRRCPTLRSLLEALDPHLDRMPVGLILTSNGEIPGASAAPPPAFQALVRELQKELDREKILYTFLLPAELHVVE